MNKQRRKRIMECINKLEQIQYELEAIRDEEQGAFDNLPESLQSSEKGEVMEEYIDYINDADDTITDAIDYLDNINNY